MRINLVESLDGRSQSMQVVEHEGALAILVPVVVVDKVVNVRSWTGKAAITQWKSHERSGRDGGHDAIQVTNNFNVPCRVPAVF